LPTEAVSRNLETELYHYQQQLSFGQQVDKFHQGPSCFLHSDWLPTAYTKTGPRPLNLYLKKKNQNSSLKVLHTEIKLNFRTLIINSQLYGTDGNELNVNEAQQKQKTTQHLMSGLLQQNALHTAIQALHYIQITAILAANARSSLRQTSKK
jgi:hypothetical protein